MKIYVCMLMCLVFFYAHSASTDTLDESVEIRTIKQKISTSTTDEEMVWAYNDLAWEYHFTNYDSSLKYVDLAMQKLDGLDDANLRAITLEMKAILMEISGQVEKALKFYFEVISIRESLGGAGLENTYNNIAAIFRNQENYPKALEYFEKSYEIEKEINNPEGIAGSLTNIALALKNMGRTDSVEAFLQRALSIADSLGNHALITDIQINLANFYYQSGQYNQSKAFYENTAILSRVRNLQGSLSFAALGQAQIEFINGNNFAALKHLAVADSAARKANILNLQARIANLYSDIFAVQDNYKAAWERRGKYLELKDSVARKELVDLANNLEMRYESERKERQIAELQLKTAEQELLAVSNRNQRNILIFLAVLLILGVVVITYRYIVQQRVSGILQQKNKTIEEALQERELLIKEIHHRVKNNLQIVSSLLSIQGREIKDQKAMEAVKESKDRVQSMALIHQYLYGEHNLQSIDMPEYITELSHKLFSAYRLDRDCVSIQVHSDPVFLDVDTAIPVGIILNELITNALKYAFPEGEKGELLVSLKEEGGRLNLRVRDSGVGLDTTKNSEFSFGMKLLRAFEKKLDANITIKSENGTDILYSIGKYKTTWKKSIAS